MAAPIIVINGGTPGAKAAVSAGGAVSATLDDTTGVRTVAWSIASTDETSAVGDYTLVTSGTVGENVSTTALVAGTAAILKAVINGGINLQTGLADAENTTATAKFGVLTAGGAWVGAAGEKLEHDTTYGYTEVINFGARNVAGSAVQSVSGTDPIDIDNSDPVNLVASWQPGANVEMLGYGFTHCASVTNASGGVAVTAGGGAASLAGSTTATVSANGGALLLEGATTATLTAGGGNLTLDSSASVLIGGTNATDVSLGRSGQTITIPDLAGGGLLYLTVDNSGIVNGAAASGAEPTAPYIIDSATAVNANDVPAQAIPATLDFIGTSAVTPATFAYYRAAGAFGAALKIRRTILGGTGAPDTSTGAYVSWWIPNDDVAPTEVEQIRLQPVLTAIAGANLTTDFQLHLVNAGALTNTWTWHADGSAEATGAILSDTGFDTISATTLVLGGTNATDVGVDTSAGTVTWEKGGNPAAVDTWEPTGATTRVLDAGVTSYAWTWTQDGSAAGGQWSIEGQQGANGFAGGDVKVAVGKGGNPGTDTPGNILLETGQQVSQITGQVRFQSNGSSYGVISTVAGPYLSIKNGAASTAGIYILSTSGLARLEGASTAALFAGGGATQIGSSTGVTEFYSGGVLRSTFTWLPTAAQSLVFAAQAGTGSNAGQTFTLKSQPGQNVAAGTNNDGGALDLRSGIPGTGGTGGSDGTTYLRTGSTTRVELAPTGAQTLTLANGAVLRKVWGTGCYTDEIKVTFTSDSGVGYETAYTYAVPDDSTVTFIVWATAKGTSKDAAGYGKRLTVKRSSAGVATVVGAEKDLGSDAEDNPAYALRVSVDGGNNVTVEVDSDSEVGKWGVKIIAEVQLD